MSAVGRQAAVIDARVALGKWWAQRDKNNPSNPPLTPEEKTTVDRLCVALWEESEKYLRGPERVTVQDTDRANETQLDAMRATIKRMGAENEELRAEVVGSVEKCDELARKQRLWEGTRYARSGRVSSYALWLALVRALGVDCNGLSQMHEVQAAALEQIARLRDVQPTPREPKKRSKRRCPVDQCPAPGDVGLDKRAVCPMCKRRVAVTVRGRYAPHDAAPRKRVK